MSDKTIIIENPGDPETRKRLALIMLRARLTLAIQMGSTDTFALHRARGWAKKLGITVGVKTMKQNLRWIESEIKKIADSDEQDR
ncbi:hypothetical protein HWC34_gp25 [Microbacterium phage Alex44]|uniref:Uncharacterized protein n=1 Tax=Microbacterium phage Alex44 TaxID=2590877 RepID=A0A4Y6ED74_9CAUD|nr:hypothetical protein HWC34_gp25 [Microbacterium phage Alex44]QDF15935.1 hypothetical protein SEA_ALEX44_25 [Microbacterium phage Alex44]